MVRALVVVVLLAFTSPADARSIQAPACFDKATIDGVLHVFKEDGLLAADRLLTNLIATKQCVTIGFHLERADAGQSAQYREYEATVFKVRFLEGKDWYAFVVLRRGRSA